jgi:hypothetical protein
MARRAARSRPDSFKLAQRENQQCQNQNRATKAGEQQEVAVHDGVRARLRWVLPVCLLATLAGSRSLLKALRGH